MKDLEAKEKQTKFREQESEEIAGKMKPSAGT